MKQRFALWLGMLLCLLAFRSQADIIITPGQPWRWLKPGLGTNWWRMRAEDQLKVAQEAFNRKDYSLATAAAQRVITEWNTSDFAPHAQYLLGRIQEARGKDEAAFKHYQKLFQKYPRMTNSQEVLERQLLIANRFLDGQWGKALGFIPVPPFLRGQDKTVRMYDQIITNAPFNDIAPQAQLQIGATREKQKRYDEAVKAYERAADRYSDREQIAADAKFKAGLAYFKQTKTAEYDQNAAGQAISTFQDFQTLYPGDKRVAQCDDRIQELRMEQSRGALEIARFYEKHQNRSSLLSRGDVNSYLLIRKLLARADPVSVFVWGQLAAATRQALTNPAVGSRHRESLLIADLNKMLSGPSIYEGERFAGVTLSLNTQTLSAKKPKEAGLVRLNRLLLEDAYPLAIEGRAHAKSAAEIYYGEAAEKDKGLNSKYGVEARQRLNAIQARTESP